MNDDKRAPLEASIEKYSFLVESLTQEQLRSVINLSEFKQIAFDLRELREKLCGSGGQLCHEKMELESQLTAKTEECERYRKALIPLVDDEPCRLDHHGNCQTHNLSNPCDVAKAREILSAGRRRIEG